MVPMGFQSALFAAGTATSPRPDPSGFAGEARRQVHLILSKPQYQSRPEKSFQPLSGALGAIGWWFERVFGPGWRWLVHHLFHPIGTWVTTDIGLPWPVTLLVAALVVGVVGGTIRIRRRPRIDFEVPGGTGGIQREDPHALEQLARQAELAGDLRAAIRLRFRAGVADLDRLGAISRGPTRTTGELSNALESRQFDALAADLEAVVYGGVEPTPEQADAARSGWRVVVSQVTQKTGNGKPPGSEKSGDPVRSDDPARSTASSAR